MSIHSELDPIIIIAPLEHFHKIMVRTMKHSTVWGVRGGKSLLMVPFQITIARAGATSPSELQSGQSDCNPTVIQLQSNCYLTVIQLQSVSSQLGTVQSIIYLVLFTISPVRPIGLVQLYVIYLGLFTIYLAIHIAKAWMCRLNEMTRVAHDYLHHTCCLIGVVAANAQCRYGWKYIYTSRIPVSSLTHPAPPYASCIRYHTCLFPCSFNLMMSMMGDVQE